MSKHEIHLTIPPKTVLNKDAECDIYSDGALLGTLKISKGSLEWRPKKYTYGYHIDWEGFDKIMQEHGRQV